MPPLANLAISNVPGPNMALYLAGAKMLTYYPVSIVTHSLALNVTVQSYNGSLDFGLIACRTAMPDLPELAKYMQKTFDEMLAFTPKSDTVVVPTADAAQVSVKKTVAKNAVVKKAMLKSPAVKKVTEKKLTAKKTAAKR
jgi:hypothetical protein